MQPPDLERIFSLPRGNIFHGAMGLDQVRLDCCSPSRSRLHLADDACMW